MLVQEPVQAAIWHCLNHYDYKDAIFLAERLRAEVESDETIWLLATCYYRAGKPAQAYHILKNTSSPQCKFLLARCCLDLIKLSEAERVLCGGELGRGSCVDDVVKEFGDMASFTLLMLAHIHFHTERHDKAVHATTKALKLNPVLWSGYESLCRAGEKPNPHSLLNLSSLDHLHHVTGSNPLINYVNSTCSATVPPTPTPMPPAVPPATPPPLTTTRSAIQVSPEMEALKSSGGGGMYCCMSGVRAFTPDISPLPLPPSCRPKRSIRYRNIFSGSLSPLTPSFGVIPLDMNSSVESHPSPLNTLTEANEQKLSNKREGRGLRDGSGGGEGRAPSLPLPLPSTPRRSTRLFSNAYSVKENSKSPNSKFVGGKVNCRKAKGGRGLGKGRNTVDKDPTSPPPHQPHTPTLPPADLTVQALHLQRLSLEGLMVLLKEMGVALLYLTEFECKRCIKVLSALPPHHKNTGWVLCTIGRAYFEMSDYNHAVKYFAEAHSREPERTELMEVYSTCLWHLGRESQLSCLAQDMISMDRLCPQTWCVAGNSLSLNKEHDTAIKLFHRAVQVDPNFVYAYTLLGHEFAVTEDLERGMAAFRNAIRLDIRHYNAWYGMGTIYSKQEKFQLAEMHYKRALTINPNSCVLMCHIAVMQLALQKKEEALETLERALRVEPNNALCRFQRARVLTSCGAHQEALVELEHLKQLVPKESMVYYLTGKVHKKLGNTHLAIMHFSWATDLDPKGNTSQIKEAIDSSLPRHSDHLGEEMSGEELLMTPNQGANDANSSPNSDLVF